MCKNAVPNAHPPIATRAASNPRFHLFALIKKGQLSGSVPAISPFVFKLPGFAHALPVHAPLVEQRLRLRQG